MKEINKANETQQIKVKYVLVSQDIKIVETYDKQEAIDIMENGNKEWYKYVQECKDKYEPYADNEIFMYEEFENEQ